MEKNIKKEQTLSKNLVRLRQKSDKFRLAYEEVEQQVENAAQELAELQATNLDKQQKAIINPPRARKVSDIPDKKVAMAVLATKLVQNWQTHFTDMQVPQINRAIFSDNAQQLTLFINKANQLVTSKKANTLELDNVNNQIDKAISELKTALRPFHRKEVIDGVYQAHGLIKDYRKIYNMPKDNTIRVRQMAVLANKLQELNNPLLALSSYSTQFWLDLQQRHSQLWQESERLRQERSDTVRTVDIVLPLVEADVKQLHGFMQYAFPSGEVKSRRRLMGFLKESL